MLKKHLRSEASKLFLKRLMLALSVALVITFLLLIKNIHSVSRDGILHKRQVASAALDLSYIDYF